MAYARRSCIFVSFCAIVLAGWFILSRERTTQTTVSERRLLLRYRREFDTERHRLAVIVPFRDRETHLRRFVDVSNVSVRTVAAMPIF